MQEKTTISLGDSLCISNACATQKRLIKALEKSYTVELKADAVQKVDTAGLQLIISLKQEIDIQGGKIIWKKPSSEILNSAQLLGLREDLGLHY